MPTFVRGLSESFTFTSVRIREEVNNWRVLTDEWLSLHKYIVFSIGGVSVPFAQNTYCGWKIDNLDKHLCKT